MGLPALAGAGAGGATMLMEGGAAATGTTLLELATGPVGWTILGLTVVGAGAWWLMHHKANEEADDRASPAPPAAVCNCPADKAGEAPPTDVYIDPDKYPEAAGHVKDAQDAGHPAEGTIDRDGAAARRRAATSGTPTEAGKDRDEYPPAIVQEGGSGSSVRTIPSGDNRGAGGSMGGQIRDLPDGSRIRIIPGPKP